MNSETRPSTGFPRPAPLPLLVRLSLLLHAAMALALLAQPSAWRWVLAAFLANHLLLTLVGLWPRSTWLGRNWTRLPAASADPRAPARSARRASARRRPCARRAG